MSDSSTMFTLVFSDTLSTTPHLAQQLGDYSTSCKVRPGHSYPFHLLPQEIKIDEILYSSERTAVYAGRCSDGLELALKFTNIKDMSTEAGVYDTFEAIQGTVLPKLYGILVGKDRQGDILPCMVLERFGNRLEQHFYDLPKAEKAKILNKLAEAHRAGLVHRDFAERNVVVKGEDYRIIDWARAKRHNSSCRWTYDFTAHVEDDDVDPADPAVQCFPLKSWAEHMQFWDHGELLLSHVIVVPKSDKLPPQHIVDCLGTAIGTSVNGDYVVQDRQQIGAKYLAIVWEQMTKYNMPLKDVQRRRRYFTYLAHKEWHEERNEIFVPLPSMNFTGYKPDWITCESESSSSSEDSS